LEAAGQGSFSGRLAHYLCEQAAALLASQKPEEANTLLRQAMDTAPQSPRPRMDLAALQSQQGDHQQACATLTEAIRQAPAATPLIAPLLAEAAIASGSIAPTLALMQTCYAETPSIDVLDAIVSLEAANGDAAVTARQWYARHLEKEPSLVAAAKWIAGEKLEHEQFHPQVQRALDHAVKPLTRYRCAACGFEAKRHFWQCPGCQAWDSYPARRVEEL
jgi:lipopolysaccharide biosynthesis regulator YciM